MWELWIISLCTIFVVGFNNLIIIRFCSCLLFIIGPFSALWLVIFDLLFYATFVLAWDYLIACEAKILYCLPYLTDLSSEVTICCQVAIPGTDGNEHCTSVDGCLKWCWSLVQCIHINGKCGRNDYVFITVTGYFHQTNISCRRIPLLSYLPEHSAIPFWIVWLKVPLLNI